jgi:hypothetical protein
LIQAWHIEICTMRKKNVIKCHLKNGSVNYQTQKKEKGKETLYWVTLIGKCVCMDGSATSLRAFCQKHLDKKVCKSCAE